MSFLTEAAGDQSNTAAKTAPAAESKRHINPCDRRTRRNKQKTIAQDTAENCFCFFVFFKAIFKVFFVLFL